jgi:hypothetical protein
MITNLSCLSILENRKAETRGARGSRRAERWVVIFPPPASWLTASYILSLHFIHESLFALRMAHPLRTRKGCFVRGRSRTCSEASSKLNEKGDGDEERKSKDTGNRLRVPGSCTIRPIPVGRAPWGSRTQALVPFGESMVLAASCIPGHTALPTSDEQSAYALSCIGRLPPSFLNVAVDPIPRLAVTAFTNSQAGSETLFQKLDPSSSQF